MAAHRIAVLKGDGIGPEVISQALKLVRVLNKRYGSELQVVEFPYGADYYLQTGISLPDEFVEQLEKNYEAVLMGPFGDPRIPDMKNARQIVLGMREKLNLFISVMPVRLYQNWLSPLKNLSNSVDFLLFRENMEGITIHEGSRLNIGQENEIALQNIAYSRKGVAQFVQATFQYLNKFGRKQVTFVDWGSPTNPAHILWRSVLDQYKEEHTTLDIKYLLLNQAIFELVTKPDEIDSMMSSNLYADVLFALAASLTGGYGTSFSLDLNPGRIAVFRIMQSSSPKMVGHNTANPLGAVFALHYMLKFLELNREEAALEKAIQLLLDKHWVTIDLGGLIGTEELGDYLCDFLENPVDEDEGSGRKNQE